MNGTAGVKVRDWVVASWAMVHATAAPPLDTEIALEKSLPSDLTSQLKETVIAGGADPVEPFAGVVVVDRVPPVLHRLVVVVGGGVTRVVEDLRQVCG